MRLTPFYEIESFVFISDSRAFGIFGLAGIQHTHTGNILTIASES
jgi:preprotein translocase subunit SecB